MTGQSTALDSPRMSERPPPLPHLRTQEPRLEDDDLTDVDLSVVKGRWTDGAMVVAAVVLFLGVILVLAMSGDSRTGVEIDAPAKSRPEVASRQAPPSIPTRAIAGEEITVTLEVVPEDAVIYVDGRVTNDRALAFEAGDKAVFVEFTRQGYRSEMRRIQLHRSHTVAVELSSL